MKIYPKINLELKVNGKLDDVYHNLLMTNVRVKSKLYDKITLKKNKTDIFLYKGIKLPGDNSLVKTLNLIRKTFSIRENFKVKLVKKIPLGSGLGGGSMDAAALILLILKKCKIKTSKDVLKKVCFTLDSDSYYGLFNKPMICEKRGEVVKEASIKETHITLILFPFSFSTKEMFALLDEMGVCEFLPVAIIKNKILARVYQKLKENNFLIKLSGTGPSLFVYGKHKKKIKKILNGENVKVITTKIII